ncbi:L-PSP family endoribonuclease [Pandoraea iniqua]|uniref:L-PSP family endoribonuclease n=1 Tax=Pandoraea iniqua TaxID=2508288 RepID=A0A5E4VT44_9BURK|nr:RidA family protein [Pandoraea iniqua]VVE15562.1 L-PSP family endoribonuclease [Pandoraea iniqua]
MPTDMNAATSAPSNNAPHFDAVVIHHGIAYVSGQVSRTPDGIISGHLADDSDIDLAREAARVSILRALAALQTHLGDMGRIDRILTLKGFVNAAPTFTRHGEVIDAASELLIARLGNKGRHARTSLGVSGIPSGGLVEIELVAAVSESR